MAKSKRRPTLREQVYRLKRHNKALERYWDEAHRDFVRMEHNFLRMAHIAKQSQELAGRSTGQTKQVLERIRAALDELATTRDPTPPLQ